MTEEWRSVLAWPFYEVSSLGRIRRIKNGNGTRAGRLLKPHPYSNGYLRVGLCDGTGAKGQRDLLFHRLVCAAFHGPAPFAGAHAAHRNGNQTDNRASNLYWATVRENALDRQRHGRGIEGERNPSRKLNAADVLRIRQIAVRGQYSKVAKEFGVSVPTISVIASRKTWKHIA